MQAFSAEDLLVIFLAAKWTLGLFALAYAGGLVGGLLVALLRTSRFRPLRWLTAGFVVLFQGTPLLVQLLLAFFIPPLFLKVDPQAWAVAAVLMAVHASAFIGEILRGGIEALPRGQIEAARALGLGPLSRLFEVVLPQALRIALPALVGFSVQLLKGTSLASAVGIIEITKTGQTIANVTFQPFPAFAMVAATYFILCWPLSILGRYLEGRAEGAVPAK